MLKTGDISDNLQFSSNVLSPNERYNQNQMHNELSGIKRANQENSGSPEHAIDFNESLDDDNDPV